MMATDACDSLHITGRFRRMKVRNGKTCVRTVHNDLAPRIHDGETKTYLDTKNPSTSEEEIESIGTPKHGQGQSGKKLRMQLPLDSPSSSPHWDMSFATPSSWISEDSGCSSPPLKQKRITSPLTPVALTPSPLSYSMSVQPLCLDKELAEVDSPLTTPPVTPPPRSFSSPPHIERLRLFDTPQTPKSIIRRSSIMEVDDEEAVHSVKDPSTCRQRISRVSRSGPELRRRASRGTNINPFASVQRTRRAKGRNGFCSAPTSTLRSRHKKLALRESNIYRFRQEFLELGVVGAGSFGIVYKCINRLDGCVYALKRSHQPVAGSANESTALREVYAHAVLGSHPHLVRYYSAWAEDNHMIIQNEFCNGGNLSSVILAYKKMGIGFSEEDLKRLMSHLAKGLQYIHSMGLVHLDIKPENIFLCLPEECFASDSESSVSNDSMEGVRVNPSWLENNPTYKIGDMGHVTSISDPQVEEGDCRYLSRELLQEDCEDLRKADVFSLGLTVFATGSMAELPKNGDEWHQIRDGYLPALPQCPEQFNSFLLSLINPVPALRPTTSDIIVHPLVCPNAEKSQAQLRKELNEERLKNEKLSRELQALKRANEGVTSFVAGKKRLVGGLRTQRSNSVVDF